MPAELGELGGGGVGMHPLHHLGDLPVEHAQPALRERPVDPSAKLLLLEPEPSAARPLTKDPVVDEPLELLDQRLLGEAHGGGQEVEVELRPDGARVGEDP